MRLRARGARRKSHKGFIPAPGEGITPSKWRTVFTLLVDLKREPKRARAMAEQAREALKKSAWAHKDLEETEAWLAKNFPE